MSVCVCVWVWVGVGWVGRWGVRVGVCLRERKGGDREREGREREDRERGE